MKEYWKYDFGDGLSEQSFKTREDTIKRLTAEFQSCVASSLYKPNGIKAAETIVELVKTDVKGRIIFSEYIDVVCTSEDFKNEIS